MCRVSCVKNVCAAHPILWYWPAEGTAVVLDLFLQEGWNGVNAALADPPSLSEQVLHPEKYMFHRDVPEEVYLPGFAGTDWEARAGGHVG